MKKLFVPYELAVKLKEKGFYEGCIAWYEPSDKTFNVLGQSGELHHDKFHLTANVKEIIQAPMYQQVTDWLEESHNMIFCREAIWDSWHWTLYKYDNGDSLTSSTPINLDQAIEEALKLI